VVQQGALEFNLSDVVLDQRSVVLDPRGLVLQAPGGETQSRCPQSSEDSYECDDARDQLADP
jgi:hypothetical protein